MIRRRKKLELRPVTFDILDQACNILNLDVDDVLAREQPVAAAAFDHESDRGRFLSLVCKDLPRLNKKQEEQTAIAVLWMFFAEVQRQAAKSGIRARVLAERLGVVGLLGGGGTIQKVLVNQPFPDETHLRKLPLEDFLFMLAERGIYHASDEFSKAVQTTPLGVA